MTSDDVQVIPGAEAYAADGGRDGVLVLHGFTGNPQSMRGLAEAFATAGFTVELPRLAGHGTTVDDMLTTSWSDWSADVEAAYGRLAAKTERIVVAGLSMGGLLTLQTALEHPDVAGIICINAVIEDAGPLRDMVQQMIEAGEESFDAIGSDIADPDQAEASYDATPLRPLLSMMDAGDGIRPRLGEITCPALLMTSPQDHVVAPSNSDFIAASLGGPVERVTLERSYHVATLDYDRELIAQRAVAFVENVTAR